MEFSWLSCDSSCPQMGLGVESKLSLRTAAVMMGSSTLLDPAGLLERAGLGAEVLPWESVGFLYLYVIHMVSSSQYPSFISSFFKQVLSFLLFLISAIFHVSVFLASQGWLSACTEYIGMSHTKTLQHLTLFSLNYDLQPNSVAAQQSHPVWSSVDVTISSAGL